MNIELIKIVFDNGNFGRKRLTVFSKDERKILNSVNQIKQRGLVSYSREIGIYKSKICRKHSFLKRFAWIYGLIILIYKGLKVRIRSDNVKEQISINNERKTILENLGIKFEDN